VSAEKVGSLAGTSKISCSFPMDAYPPVSKGGAMTFAAEPVAFREVNEFPIVKPQLISIFRIMAIEAPSHCLCMMQLDPGMFFF